MDDVKVELTKLAMRVDSIESNFSEIKKLQQETINQISSMHTDLVEKQAESNNATIELRANHSALDARVRKTERDVDRLEDTVQKTQVSLAKLAAIGGGSGAVIAAIFKLMEMAVS